MIQKSFLFFVTFCVTIFSGCGRWEKRDARIANVPGEDSTSALLPGQGFNPVDNKAK